MEEKNKRTIKRKSNSYKANGKKRKIDSYMLILFGLNAVFLIMVGVFVFNTMTNANAPIATTIAEAEVVVGESLPVINADTVTEENPVATDIVLTNETEEDKEYYLIFNVEAEQEVLDVLTIQIKDGNIFAVAVPNNNLKKITLAPGESDTIQLRFYIDSYQLLDENSLDGQIVKFEIIDDYGSYYNYD